MSDMKVALTLADNSLPPTIFYQRFLESLRRSSRFESDESAADVLIADEDTARETNWPRYGDPAAAAMRGADLQAPLNAYLQRVAQSPRPICVLTMHPGIRLPQYFGH